MMTIYVEPNVIAAARAVVAFREQYGEDACEDMPSKYFETMRAAFGSEPSEQEVVEIENVSWSSL